MLNIDELEPISFPHRTADETAEVCRSVANLLDEHLDARTTDLVPTARFDWTGAYRNEFDTTWAKRAEEVRCLIRALRDLANDIDHEIDAVDAENRRRQDAREAIEAEGQRPA